LKSNKILILLALALLFSETNCHASRHNEFDEEHISSKMLRKLSDVFTCLFGSCIGASTKCNYKKLPSHKETYEIEELGAIEKQTVKILPNEVLFHLAGYLSPPDIVNLIKSNRRFLC
jgi:hypothetical protein